MRGRGLNTKGTKGTKALLERPTARGAGRALAALALALVCAATAGATTRSVLPNGVRVLISPNPATEVMTASLLLNVPAGAEAEGQEGIRYLTSRMLLRGTESETGDQMGERLAAVGGTITVNVALDYVEVMVRAPSDGFDAAMDLLAKAVQEPAFPREELERERERVVTAMAGAKGDPFQRTYQALREELYDREPYARWAMGSAAVVEKLSRMDVVLFYSAFYRPEAAVLSIAGGVDSGQALAAAKQRFGTWKGEGKAKAWRPSAEARLDSSQVTVRELKTPRLHVMLGFPAPAVGEPGYYPMQVIDSLLGGGSTARLPKALREEEALAYEVSSFYPTLAGESHLGIYAVTEAANLGEVKGAILKQLQRLRDEPVPAGELARAKRRLLGAYALSRQDSASQAYTVGWYELLGCPPDFPSQYQAQVNAVTAQQVQETARQLIHHFILALTVPVE